MTQLERFLFEEACCLEQAAALTGWAREFLKEQRVLEPAEFPDRPHRRRAAVPGTRAHL